MPDPATGAERQFCAFHVTARARERYRRCEACAGPLPVAERVDGLWLCEPCAKAELAERAVEGACGHG